MVTESERGGYANALPLGILGLYLTQQTSRQVPIRLPLIKNKVTGMIVGGWCLAFTAFACILGMVPKLDMSADPGTWWFQLALNILTPVIFLALGLILPAIARHDKKKLA